MSALAAAPTLYQLTGLLDDLPRDNDDATNASNLRLIAELATPPSILSIIHEALEAPMMLARIAARSYRHVNHFDKVVLVDSDVESDYRLTMHLWKPPYTEAEVTDELIHDHRFNFWSSILAGTLRSETFERSEEDGSTYRQYRYVPELKTRTNFYEFVGEGRLKSTGVVAKSTGVAYHLNHQGIHRVQLPMTGMTCTLVLRGPRQRRFSNVYNTTYPETDTSSANRAFTPEELAARLLAIAGAIG